MSWFTHRFEATITRHAVGTYQYTVVYLDAAIAASLPFDRYPRLRVEADVGGVPVKGAWQPAKGVWYLMLPKAPLRHAGLRLGDRVEVAFRVVDQNEVDIPPELQTALDRSAKRRKSWAAFTAGTQRGLAYLVDSAKRATTREARLAMVLAVLDDGAPLPWARQKRGRGSSRRARD